jgi:hypothetical protein
MEVRRRAHVHPAHHLAKITVARHAEVAPAFRDTVTLLRPRSLASGC